MCGIVGKGIRLVGVGLGEADSGYGWKGRILRFDIDILVTNYCHTDCKSHLIPIVAVKHTFRRPGDGIYVFAEDSRNLWSILIESVAKLRKFIFSMSLYKWRRAFVIFGFDFFYWLGQTRYLRTLQVVLKILNQEYFLFKHF